MESLLGRRHHLEASGAEEPRAKPERHARPGLAQRAPRDRGPSARGRGLLHHSSSAGATATCALPLERPVHRPDQQHEVGRGGLVARGGHSLEADLLCRFFAFFCRFFAIFEGKEREERKRGKEEKRKQI